VMATAIVIASLMDLASRLVRARWFTPGASAVVALIVLGNALGITDAVADFAELGRQTRVPFRDISQRHSSFPDDTYLYFINPPTITSQLSGMFFLRYGEGVRVASNEYANQRANLHEHANVYVIYFDEQSRTRELPVEKQQSIGTRPALPIDFVVPIRLEDYELAAANLKRDQAVVLLLYWRALDRVEKDYATRVYLLDANGKIVASSEREPLRGTSLWTSGVRVVDAVVLPVASIAPGEYRLELALMDGAQSVSCMNANGESLDGQIMIAPVKVGE
jgi:hypothetical protein